MQQAQLTEQANELMNEVWAWKLRWGIDNSWLLIGYPCVPIP